MTLVCRLPNEWATVIWPAHDGPTRVDVGISVQAPHENGANVK